MSQGFGYPICRYTFTDCSRWGLTNGKNVIQTEKDLKKLFPKKIGTNFIFK